ncbi:MAG: hypothetical protein JWP91_2775 [Fibrobacteres bacterium]|nr:hypothetical protein [Fibrobacterota bacterium]
MIRRRWIFAAVVGVSIGFGKAGRVCDLAFSDCPGRFSSGTVKVPNEMIWLDSKIPFCNEFVQITNGNVKPPSVIFIIDNSGSMDENDPLVARFDVVATLLDNIYTFAPSAEVGLVVFTRRLSFDHRENPFFKTAFPADTAQHDSFVPLTALNKIFADGRTGLDTLKAMLKHDDKGNLTYVTKLPASRNNSGMGRSNTRDGTDISLGFMAGKVAMKDSKSDKANQYFVFLSDGTPSTPDNGREGMINEFIAGTGVPTTFTVFFDTQNNTPVAPSTIVEMTGKIKLNGYSLSNAKSAFWAIDMPGSQLQNLLQTQVIGNVLSVPAKPKAASLAMGDTTFRTVGLDAKNYLFPRHVALQEDTTRLQLDYTYSYIDTTGGLQVPKEKIVPYALTIVRSPNAPLPVGMAQSCKEQADISLFHDGQPITRVTADDGVLEARLTMPDGSLCQGCKMQVLPSSSKSKDHEDLMVAPAGGYLTGTFQREISASPTLGDGRLQHLPLDSIVVLFVSPENALDRVRKAFPYTDMATVLNLGRQNDLAKSRYIPTSPFEPQWILEGAPTLQATAFSATDVWRVLQAPLAPQDSERFIGVTVEASRAFMVDIHVFTNLGQFVNKLTFVINQDEFQKLAKGVKGNTRVLKILWDSRSRAGSLVGTGAYVMKTTVTLIKIPGIAEDNAIRTDYRRVGVLRRL